MQDLSPSEIEAIAKSLGNGALETTHAFKRKSENLGNETLSSLEKPSGDEENLPRVSRLQFTQLKEGSSQGSALKGESVQNIKIEINVILGRTKIPLKELLEAQAGSVIELDKLAGEPVELEANGTVVGWGEVVVVNDNFGVRITKIFGATS
jgi:flagellar motor switch protein FliN/FliY